MRRRRRLMLLLATITLAGACGAVHASSASRTPAPPDARMAPTPPHAPRTPTPPDARRTPTTFNVAGASTTVTRSTGAACSTPAQIGPLPLWARAGFFPPSTPTPYVMGRDGNIVAILWRDTQPLHAPAVADQTNKILWVSRLATDGAPLQIHAVLTGDGRTVTREVAGGPGPSYVNLPVAGCWALDLAWSGHHDRVDLRYV